MKLLFLGAGATGGYFGGRLANAGVDVTFLVRPRRRDQLARNGLRIEGPYGNLTIAVRAITRDEIREPYDAVIVGAKAYDLDDAIDAIRPAVGGSTLILPLLNGMKHLDVLDAAFGASRVLGGFGQISATLTDDGIIRQLGGWELLTLGPRFAEQKTGATKLNEALARGTETRFPDDVIAAMWEKWYLTAALASLTCLMRANVGEVVRAERGLPFITCLLNECIAIAAANGYPIQPAALDFGRAVLSDPASTFAASMLRDIEHGGRIEADQIVGDIIRRGRERGVATPLLETAYLHLLAYENRRAAAISHAPRMTERITSC